MAGNAHPARTVDCSCLEDMIVAWCPKCCLLVSKFTFIVTPPLSICRFAGKQRGRAPSCPCHSLLHDLFAFWCPCIKSFIQSAGRVVSPTGGDLSLQSRSLMNAIEHCCSGYCRRLAPRCSADRHQAQIRAARLHITSGNTARWPSA